MITHPTAVRFCNDRVRILADRIAAVHAVISLFAGEFAAKNLAAVIPDDAEQVVLDGSETDGRSPITGADVHVMLALAGDLLAMATGPSSKMATVLKVAVNPI